MGMSAKDKVAAPLELVSENWLIVGLFLNTSARQTRDPISVVT